MKRGSMDLTVKAIFAVFIVLFILFIAITALRSNIGISGQKNDFGSQEAINSFFISLLSNPSCLTAGEYTNASGQTPIHGLLDYKKISRMDNLNTDPSCSRNFLFIYSVEIFDSVNRKRWIIGLNETDMPWVVTSVKRALPVAIMYDKTNVNLGEASIIAYTGEIPLFYGRIKRACVLKKGMEVVSVINNFEVSYESSKNEFCIGKSCFTPSFPCNVDSFSLAKGEHKVYLSYKDGRLVVK